MRLSRRAVVLIVIGVAVVLLVATTGAGPVVLGTAITTAQSVGLFFQALIPK